MNSFKEAVLTAIRKHSMCSKGDSVIVALSGGADSVSLFKVLLDLKDKLEINIMAAHVNHNLRGDEALRDENFVKKLCKENNIELFVKSVDVARLSSEQKISTELCGRNVRYEFFSELHEKYNAKIATAHTASDNAETILFNLIRGTGVDGMSGIVPVRDYIIRPLTGVTRRQVEEYCNNRSIEYVTDSSNLTNDYTRNKIRHIIMPEIMKINPNFELTAKRTSEIFTLLSENQKDIIQHIIDMAETDGGYSVDYLISLDPATMSQTLYKLCELAGSSPEKCHIEALSDCLKKGGCTDLPNNKRAVSSQGKLRFIEKSHTKTEINLKEIPLKINHSFSFNGKNYTVTKSDSQEKDLLSMNILENNPCFRTRRHGDSFTLPKRNVTKSLKKLMNELKIPREARDNLLVLACGNTVLWCEGIGISKHGISTDTVGIKIEIN